MQKLKTRIDTPTIGELRRERDLNRCQHSSLLYIWHSCSKCHQSRWVRYSKKRGQPYSDLCGSCAMKGKLVGCKNPSWKGGQYITPAGYIRVLLPKASPFYEMAGKNGYIFEHRLVMAQHLGRCLDAQEIVHHKNGMRTNNELGNLELSTNGRHIKEHSKGYQDGYEKGYEDGQSLIIRELRQEMRLLRWELKGTGKK